MKTKIVFTNLHHDTGDFRWSYLRNPPTGRSKIDYVFILLTMGGVAAMWMLYFLDPACRAEPPLVVMPIMMTLGAVVCHGSACRDVKTVRKWFKQCPLTPEEKVNYAHYQRSGCLIFPVVGMASLWFVAHHDETLFLCVIAAAVVYAIGMSYVFKVGTKLRGLQWLDELI